MSEGIDYARVLSVCMPGRTRKERYSCPDGARFDMLNATFYPSHPQIFTDQMLAAATAFEAGTISQRAAMKKRAKTKAKFPVPEYSDKRHAPDARLPIQRSPRPCLATQASPEYLLPLHEEPTTAFCAAEAPVKEVGR